MSKESYLKHLSYLPDSKKNDLIELLELNEEEAEYFFANIGYQMEQDFRPRIGKQPFVNEQVKALGKVSKVASELVNTLKCLHPTLLQPIKARVGNALKIPLPKEHPLNQIGWDATDDADILLAIETIVRESNDQATYYKELHGTKIYDHTFEALSKAWSFSVDRAPIKFHENSKYIQYLSIIMDIEAPTVWRHLQRSFWKNRFDLANPK